MWANLNWVREEKNALNLQFHGARGEGGAEKPSPEAESWPGVCLALLTSAPPNTPHANSHPKPHTNYKPLGRVGRVGREPGPRSNPCTVPPLLACGPVAMAITVLGLSFCICGMEMITLSLGGPNTSEMGRVWSGVGGCGAGRSSL